LKRNQNTESLLKTSSFSGKGGGFQKAFSFFPQEKKREKKLRMGPDIGERLSRGGEKGYTHSESGGGANPGLGGKGKDWGRTERTKGVLGLSRKKNPYPREAANTESAFGTGGGERRVFPSEKKKGKSPGKGRRGGGVFCFERHKEKKAPAGGGKKKAPQRRGGKKTIRSVSEGRKKIKEALFRVERKNKGRSHSRGKGIKSQPYDERKRRDPPRERRVVPEKVRKGGGAKRPQSLYRGRGTLPSSINSTTPNRLRRRSRFLIPWGKKIPREEV